MLVSYYYVRAVCHTGVSYAGGIRVCHVLVSYTRVKCHKGVSGGIRVCHVLMIMMVVVCGDAK